MSNKVVTVNCNTLTGSTSPTIVYQEILDAVGMIVAIPVVLDSLLPTGYWVAGATWDNTRTLLYVELTNLYPPFYGHGFAQLWYILSLDSTSVLASGTTSNGNASLTHYPGSSFFSKTYGPVGCLDWENKKLVTSYGAGSGTVLVYDISTSVRSTGTNIGNIPYWQFITPSMYAENGIAWVLQTGYLSWFRYLPIQLNSTNISISQILLSVCQYCDLDPTSIDISGISDTIVGYGIGQQMTGRDALEQLLGAFGIGGIESGNKLKFVKRETT